jgi:cohesin loading factor subunit SCC2
MEELVGNTTGFAESGLVCMFDLQKPTTHGSISVSSAVVQRYFTQILDCCVTNHAAVQSSAIDILGFVVRQGLAHPIQAC